MRSRTMAACALLALASCIALAQDDPYARLRSYDYQERAALAAIQREVVSAKGAPAKLAPIEAKLLTVLKDPNATFGGKQEACKFLSSIGTARSVPTLAAMLKGDRNHADAARYALERITGPEAGAALRASLATSKGGVRIGVINSLGVRRDTASVRPLAALAAGRDPDVRAASLDALGSIGSESALVALQTLKPRDVGVMRAMLRCASVLARSGKSARPAQLYASLAGPGKPRSIRVAAMRGLAAVRASQSLAVAMGALKDNDAYVQRSAARIVAQAGDAAATQKAVAAFRTLPPDAQVALLAGWGGRREVRAADAAIAAAQSPAPEVRAAAIKAAGRIGGTRAVPVLADIAAANVPESDLARQALADMQGAQAAQAILRLAQTGKPEMRSALMAVLAERPGDASARALLTGMRDAEVPVAVAALRGLGASGGAAEIAPLATMLVGSTNDEVRDAAGRAVVACVQRSGERESAIAPVVAALSGASTSATVASLGVLAEIGGDRALAELVKASSSQYPEVKRAAVRGLAETWADSAPLPTLLAIARNDSAPAIRIIALRGYIRLVGQDGDMRADRKVDALRQALQAAARPDEKRQAFGVLRDCRIESAVGVLAGYLSDAELGSEAAEAILDLAAPQKRNNRDLPAVKGGAIAAALDEIVRKVADQGIKEKAAKLRGSKN